MLTIRSTRPAQKTRLLVSSIVRTVEERSKFRMNNRTLYAILGIPLTPVSHTEKLVSALGGFVAILGISIISYWVVGSHTAAIIIASMGASAVLLFAVPHGQLSQPWPVFGGHIISAIIGVACADLLANEVLAASLAVGAAIGVMYYLRCVHPPGGATALSAVIGGEAINELGYQFVITPVLINVLIILSIGVLFNALFHWRRYPSFLHEKTKVNDKAQVSGIAHEDFVYALSQIDSFIDINEHDLLRIYDFVTKKLQNSSLTPESLVVGGCYSNGKYGKDWSVRQIVDESEQKNTVDGLIIYKVVAGNGRRSSGYSTKSDFLSWAKHKVMRDEENWKRIDDSTQLLP